MKSQWNFLERSRMQTILEFKSELEMSWRRPIATYFTPH